MSENPEETSKSVEDEIIEGKNRRKVKCQYCKSIILNSKAATYANFEFQLPVIKFKKSDKNNENSDDKDTNEVETEPVSDFWLVKDMYTFENVGFSNTVGNTKYLSCADCEVGPIGYHNLTTKESFVALSRVKHV